MDKHEMKRNYGGSKELSWIQSYCSCGWEGNKHYAYNDYQHSNIKAEITKHVRELK